MSLALLALLALAPLTPLALSPESPEDKMRLALIASGLRRRAGLYS